MENLQRAVRVRAYVDLSVRAQTLDAASQSHPGVHARVLGTMALLPLRKSRAPTLALASRTCRAVTLSDESGRS